MSNKHMETLLTSFIIRERYATVRGTPRRAVIKSQIIVLKITWGHWHPQALLVGMASWCKCFGKPLGKSLNC